MVIGTPSGSSSRMFVDSWRLYVRTCGVYSTPSCSISPPVVRDPQTPLKQHTRALPLLPTKLDSLRSACSKARLHRHRIYLEGHFWVVEFFLEHLVDDKVKHWDDFLWVSPQLVVEAVVVGKQVHQVHVDVVEAGFVHLQDQNSVCRASEEATGIPKPELCIQLPSCTIGLQQERERENLRHTWISTWLLSCMSKFKIGSS